MDPFTAAVLALIAFGWATRDAWKGLGKSYAADKRKGHSEPAWWGREVLTGFPHAREPFRKTWQAHGASTRAMKADRMKDRPGQITGKRDLKDQIAEHRKLIREAKAAGQQQSPDTTRPPGDQLPAEQISPAAPQQTQAQDQTPNGDHDMATCRDPNCSCHQKAGNQPGGSQPAAPGTNGQSPNGSGGNMATGTKTTGDTNYEQAQLTFESIISLADGIDIAEPLAAAKQLADGLPAVTPDDSETPGHMADAVSHLEQAEMHRKAAADSAGRGKETLTRNFGQQHEAVQASGHDAERGFHGVG